MESLGYSFNAKAKAQLDHQLVIIQPLQKKGQSMDPGFPFKSTTKRAKTRRGRLRVNASALVAIKVRTQRRLCELST